MFYDILIGRNIIKGLKICFFCLEGEQPEFYFIDKG